MQEEQEKKQPLLEDVEERKEDSSPWQGFI